MFWQYWTTASHLTRQRIRVIFLGFLGAFAVPAGLALVSSFRGGEVAVNYSVFTMFIFPLSLGYAIVKHDLFEIDALLKRGAYYLTLTAVLTLSYVVFVSTLNLTLHTTDVAQSPVFSLLFTLAAVLLLNPLKDRVQRVVDRLFFRLSYDPKKVLETTSEELASTLRLDEILLLVWNTIRETMGIIHGGVVLLNRNRQQYVTVYPHNDNESAFAVDHPFMQRLQQQRERAFSQYDALSDEGELGSQHEEAEIFVALNAQLLVPLNLKGEVLGVLALGQKESGQFFSADDRDFLFTLANQSALSVSNALSYEEISELNAGLERKVAERTQELAHTNTELQQSLHKLEQAYRDLEHSQENLVRAEKMAALGRLTAGIAHEMNTPLGASLNSLMSLDELIREYENSIGDQDVTSGDHHEIAAEMRETVQATQQWVEKASAHIRSLKLHTRDLQQGQERTFSVVQTIEDTVTLLSHRVRMSSCKIAVACTATEPTMYGDPGKLGQVLANLINNAIDAYKDAGKSEGEIRVVVSEEGSNLEIHVLDQGCGIPAESLEKIFEELFSTKAVGEGTGLGLPISRDIISRFFGGTLRVESEVGKGSTVSIWLPRRRVADRRPVPDTLYSPFAHDEQTDQRAA
ncbi:MAG: GHKL domain-containing protein [Deltaproteobacteria bacterium]|nr:GHKL domain-containing protein [Deltaproteobacteria bacterium]